MSNPTVSFRISDYHLARGLRAIRALEPNWQLTSTSDLIRTIFNDYIAKSEFQNKTPLNVPPELLQEIIYARAGMSGKTKQLDTLQQLGQPVQQSNQPQKPDWQIQRDLEDERIFQEMRRESLAKIKDQEQQKAQESQEQAEPERDKQINEQIDLAFKSSKRLAKPSAFDDPNITDSSISSVTDFSPPEDWKK